MDYIAYYRTSTKEQNLGITAQQSAVNRFIKPGDTLIAEYVEQESGKKDKRVQLSSALKHSKEAGATLLIAKLDRLSRNLTFISQLMDSGTKFKCCDMPDANNFTIHIFAALAQQERELISTRTRSALAELKAQGVKLGKPENLTETIRAKGRQTVMFNAKEENKQVVEFIRLYREKKLTYEAIAAKLKDMGYLTRYGKQFSKGSIKRLYDRYLSNRWPERQNGSFYE